jgi:CRISPR/Cas system CSM-associated protein Csm3 (group 7 of RAMP superfamily)
METYWLCFDILSEATFGRGEGLAGVVHQEVDHDADGLPLLRGRALKGLLNEECANILYALGLQGRDTGRWQQAAQRLFGAPGSGREDDARLRIGPARLPAPLRKAVHAQLGAKGATLTPADVLDSLTAVRHQTAIDRGSGVAEEHTLRAMRVILRQTPFEARLVFVDRARSAALEALDDLALLAACTLAFRRAGTGRNRGRGRLRATLHRDQDGGPGPDITGESLERLAMEVRG